ncbi:S41 family peptidase [Porphyromonas pogonae]|nr:S41 family peptidase [Porphyromonas pogonae]
MTLGAMLSSSAQTPTPKKENKESANQYNYIRSLDVIGSVMSNINRYFVDTVSVDRMSRKGIDAMLSSLDPYTEYFAAEDTDQLKLLTKGEYGGIGSIISQRPDSTVVINEPFEGMAADKAGLKAGDVILEIDGKDFRKTTTVKVSEALKGVPGTTIKILVRRPFEKKDRLFEFKRRIVVVNPITYYGVLPGNNGYINFNSFTSESADAFKKAFNDLKTNHKIKGLVIDLRGNGGGLIEESIKMVNLFVPQGKVVVTTKGRPDLNDENIFKTFSKPVDTEIPITVLIDGQSASAAEIVTGALQDMDRAVVIGQKSYGKGLVQSTRQLPYGGVIKLTTAKYYIPSGRCIQRIDYHEAREGNTNTVTPDSLTKVFHTAGGRPVRDAGGILPDISVVPDSMPTMLFYIATNNIAFDYVTGYMSKHPHISQPEQFSITDKDYDDFKKMLIDKKFEYDRQSGKMLEKLKEVARLEGYLDSAQETIKKLEEQLKPNLNRDLEKFKPQITDYINSEIVTRVYYKKGAVKKMLIKDKTVEKALEILNNSDKYKEILTKKSDEKEVKA